MYIFPHHGDAEQSGPEPERQAISQKDAGRNAYPNILAEATMEFPQFPELIANHMPPALLAYRQLWKKIESAEAVQA